MRPPSVCQIQPFEQAAPSATWHVFRVPVVTHIQAAGTLSQKQREPVGPQFHQNLLAIHSQAFHLHK